MLPALRPRVGEPTHGSAMMGGMRPMLATATDHLPTGEGWVHEVKWDGVRVLVDAHDGVARMTSRNDNAVTAAWPDLSTPPLGDRDVLVDGTGGAAPVVVGS